VELDQRSVIPYVNVMTSPVTAAVLLIGDELLSGRTQDTNLRSIAEFLAPIGVEIREARVIPDDLETIVSTVRHLSASWTYVFSTGGIGPTHDDITADAMAAAFNRSIDVRDDALALLKKHYGDRGQEITEGRLRMARIPQGASLILNPVSGAPGFQLNNVFVMAGVPAVMRGMLQDLSTRITGGQVVLSKTVRGRTLREGDIASALGEIARHRPEVSIGSYPWIRPGGSLGPDYGVNLVARSRSAEKLTEAVDALIALVRSQNIEPETDPED
jgi:molybdenum cofactor synthesis domain-containing protein